MIIKNIYTVTNPYSEAEIIEEILSSNSFRVERIISYGHATPDNEWYDQDTDELVLLLKGDATILFQNERINLFEGDYLLIPKHEKHRVEAVSKDALWFCIHFNK